MRLEDLGYNDKLEQFRIEQNLHDFTIGRVIKEHRERYIVMTEDGEFETEITGNIRFTAESREDFPAVGDWVALTIYDAGLAVINRIIPRYSVIKRHAVGQFGEVQIIATNIDVALIVMAVDRDFNMNRLERYLTICYSSEVEPVIVLSKTDLVDENHLNEIFEIIKTRIDNVPVLAISNKTLNGYEALKGIIKKQKTYCVLGSSGVGKSTLINNLSGNTIMKTDAISESTSKGKHITSHRELILLDKGGIIIDNPGMREVGLADSTMGLETTFAKIMELAENCRFKNCKHTHETGCAVRKAVETGVIEKAAYENFLKMEREKEHFESTLAERRKKEKEFGKMVKNYKKDLKRNQHLSQ